MENFTAILESIGSQNEAAAVKTLQQFCSTNEKTFSFFHVDLSLRKKLIDAILDDLSTKARGVTFKIHGLRALRILSRDKDGLGSLTSDKSSLVLLSLAELMIEVSKAAQSLPKKEPEQRTRYEDQQENRENTCERVIAYSDVVIEALKCLCNVVYHSQAARRLCLKYKCIEAIIARIKIWFEISRLATDVKYFDLRFLFLLTALENAARVDVISNNGFCVLTHALDSCIPGKDQRKVCHETKVREGCGQLTGARLQALTVVERSRIEESPVTYTMSQDEIRMSAEILKTMFNITINLPDADSTDTLEHCERIVFIVRTMFAHINPLSEQPENLPNHAINILSNMPTNCLQHLMWTMPSSVCKALAQDFETRRSLKTFRIYFEKYNMLTVQTMLTILDGRLKVASQPPQEEIVPFLSAFCQMARGNRVIRKYLRQEVLPPLGRVGTTRPEEGNLIRNGLVRLMTSPVGDIKELVADFLFVLCKENVNRLIKYTGYGNAAGLLASRGLMGGVQPQSIGDYSSDDDDSETEEYSMDKAQIDPMIGAIPKDDGKSNPLDEMTEQEKEEEAEKLAGLIQDLNRKGLIRTAQVGPDGRPQEFQGAQALGEEEAAEQEDEFTGDSESISNGNVDERKLS